jgi:hypothetical protein
LYNVDLSALPTTRKQDLEEQSVAASLFSLDPDVGVALSLPNYCSQRRLTNLPARQEPKYSVDKQKRGSPTRNKDVKSRLPDTNIEKSSGLTDEHEVKASVPAHKKPVKPLDKSSALPNDPHPSLEYPPVYFMIKDWPWLHEAIQSLYIYRWRASYPLQRRVPCSGDLQKLGIYFTWGELILLLPFFALIVIGTVASFVSPSVSVTGKVSRLPLIFAFLTATHNSFVTLLIGMPFERALWYHKLAGRVALINGILHTCIAFFYPDDDSSISAPPSGRYAHVKFGPFLFYDRENISGTALLFFVTGW